jgi:next to BRCA1 gene 1 protein
VEDPSFVNGKNKNAINLNLPPENNSSNSMDLIDVNMEPFTSTPGYHSYPVDVSLDAFEPKKYQAAPFTFLVPDVSAEASTYSIAGVAFSSAPTAVAPSVSAWTPEPVVPTMHLPVSMPDMTATTTAANTPFSMPNMTATTPVANTPVSVPNITATTSVNVPASAPLSASVSVPSSVDAVASESFDIDGDTEEKLLRELDEMGFKQVGLNKEILRQNKYDLEQSVDDLCGVNEWDPLLAELEEMVICMPYSVLLSHNCCYKLLTLYHFPGF